MVQEMGVQVSVMYTTTICSVYVFFECKCVCTLMWCYVGVQLGAAIQSTLNRTYYVHFYLLNVASAKGLG